MEGIEYNPINPAEYNDFVPEVEKKRVTMILWTAAILLTGFGLYKLYKSYFDKSNSPEEK